MQKLSRSQLTIGEYEAPVHPGVIKYFTDGNEPVEQYYYRDSDGKIFEISIFSGSSKEELDRRLHNLEQISRKMSLLEALGAI